MSCSKLGDGSKTTRKIGLAIIIVAIPVFFGSMFYEDKRQQKEEKRSEEKLKLERDRIELESKNKQDKANKQINWIKNNLDFTKWNEGKKLEYKTEYFSFCNRNCVLFNQNSLEIKLIRLVKENKEELRVYFSVNVGKKKKNDVNLKRNNLLFVKKTAYTYGKNVYGEAIYLIDGDGVKYIAKNGIEGIENKKFNKSAIAAILPFEKISMFYVSFQIPRKVTSSLKIVFPSLHGHQSEWWWYLYRMPQINNEN